MFSLILLDWAQRHGFYPSCERQSLSVGQHDVTHLYADYVVPDSKRMFLNGSHGRSKERVCRTPQINGGVRIGRSARERRPKLLPLVLTVSGGSVLPSCTWSEDRRTVHPSVKAWGLRWPPSPGDQHCWCPGAEVTSYERIIESVGEIGSKTQLRSTDQKIFPATCCVRRQESDEEIEQCLSRQERCICVF